VSDDIVENLLFISVIPVDGCFRYFGSFRDVIGGDLLEAKLREQGLSGEEYLRLLFYNWPFGKNETF